ncbi:hypothetical protein LOTGIDRAFT_228926 [Lottia gigantea]|uniref:Macro domain-containing protein n=1 Tax=Lottia gigantea TaxID=225164 RepID=V4A6T8_LOTGI|nr:hypothetical protein LOTGIDRAFT_228926 [Lottia gigantea]ESO88976.1 hypothetical protein LOTGIDRAFT_228926 [Lottia gigantea]
MQGDDNVECDKDLSDDHIYENPVIPLYENIDFITNQEVVYKFRDRNMRLVKEWQACFENDIKSGKVQVSHGDIFHGAPSADAIVASGNSFGFMDGGVNKAYSLHFGWQLQKRLQKLIREQHHGEILVGSAVIIPTFEGGAEQESMNWNGANENKPIKYLISATVMRAPQAVDDTVNSYLAFRAVVLAVGNFNKTLDEKIKSVLCPGLGTAAGRMPFDRCAFQMKEAYHTFVLGKNQERIYPTKLETILFDVNKMQKRLSGAYYAKRQSIEDLMIVMNMIMSSLYRILESSPSRKK